MSPSQFHAKKEITTNNINNNNNGLLPPSLKINNDSHFIKKSSSSPQSSSSSSSSTSSSLINTIMASNKPPQQQRHPVIIYTHSPKVIHTHPRDFMALVQKLTGLSRSEDDGGCNIPPQPPKKEPSSNAPMRLGDKESEHKKMVMVRNEDNETSSVITEEHNCCENQVNSCFIAAEQPILEPPMNPYVANLPVLPPNTSEFMCSSQPLLNYSDSLFFSHNMRTSIPSSATLEGMKEFRDY